MMQLHDRTLKREIEMLFRDMEIFDTNIEEYTLSKTQNKHTHTHHNDNVVAGSLAAILRRMHRIASDLRN